MRLAMGLGMRLGLLALLGLLAPGGAAAQEREGPALEPVAAAARDAWQRHDVAALIAPSPRVLVQLPGADPSAPLGPRQAVALLRDFLASAEEVEVAVRSARVVEPGRGYVELVRRFRVAGTQAERTQRLLLGYRLGRQGWWLAELRVVG